MHWLVCAILFFLETYSVGIESHQLASHTYLNGVFIGKHEAQFVEQFSF